MGWPEYQGVHQPGAPVGAEFNEWMRWVDWVLAQKERYKLAVIRKRIGKDTIMRTIKIELRVDFDDPERAKTLEDAAKVAAKHLYTTAMLIADNKRKPQIALYGGDFFSPEEEIMLADDLEENINEA